MTTLARASRLTDAQRRFVRIRGGLHVLRYAVIAGALVALASYGIIR